jgi:proteasome accessory factor B
MLRIHQALQSASLPNATTLARLLEVSTKSVHRDLDFMRDRLQLPIAYDSKRFGFYYTAEVGTFPTLQISEGELFALVVAEKALQQYRGTSFEKPLLSALRKMEQALPDTISLNLAQMEETISFRTRVEPVLSLEIFDTLARATAQRRQLKLLYRKPGGKAPEHRIVDPYHLANINGEWYLFAFDHLRKDIRTFVPARMRSVTLTGHSFSAPEKFSLDQRLRGSFGVQSGEGSFNVVLRFQARVADYIREKKWHESQQLTELAGGQVELSFNLSALSEVERWALSWGGDVRVMHPPELAQSVLRAARKILEPHPDS